MQEVLLLKCGELVLKGLNRSRFEERLMKIVRTRLRPLGEYKVYTAQSTIYVEPQNGAPVDEALEVVKKVFGVVAINRCAACEKDINVIMETAREYLADQLEAARTFKVLARRADKRFPYTSPQIGQEVGGHLHDCYPHLKPDMDHPGLTVRVEIRENYAYISGNPIQAAGGLPTGVNGRGMALLSGGIDSPVAAWMMAKRGLDISAVHFFSYPYTSEQAKEKVIDLARIVARWSGKITVSVVPFTHIQTEIRDKCQEDYFTLVMRRMMMRISQRVALHQNCGCLITGESLGQVASQTMEAMTCTGAVCDIPVFRPVIGMDKEEIVTVARKIDTFETSILPYEDCCTVFTPKHPQTKPRLEDVEREEAKLDIEALVEEAFQGVQRITVG